jgi:hypothetical protein
MSPVDRQALLNQYTRVGALLFAVLALLRKKVALNTIDYSSHLKGCFINLTCRQCRYNLFYILVVTEVGWEFLNGRSVSASVLRIIVPLLVIGE